jgi:hypothetical protein
MLRELERTRKNRDSTAILQFLRSHEGRMAAANQSIEAHADKLVATVQDMLGT